MCKPDMFGWGGGGIDEIAYDSANRANNGVNELEERLELLEKYLGLEWNERKSKYYKVADLKKAEATPPEVKKEVE